MKVIHVLSLFIAIALITVIFSCFFSKASIHQLKSVDSSMKTAAAQTNKQQIPTVFIHGWKGSERSFRTMFQRLQANYDGPERAIVITVEPNGVTKSSGKMKNQKIPLIQVIFASNHESMEQQADWLKNVFFVLKRDYGIKQVNVVSHSMGGKAFTCYLEQINVPSDYPSIKKYVAIAAPFDWINGPLNDKDYTIEQLQQNSYLFQHRSRLPKNLNVLAIAGEMRNPIEGDGVVSQQSAFFGRYFFNHAHYQEKTVYGSNAQHSMLHENPQVDRMIAEFLWTIHPK
ncbi:alpha/beta fold hydrolase [Sporolactobacillus shoreicorticis]|uniref:Alpha/beta fold hydrolase n=1 Tax=Sporolactobacillus shoreicorticis TaxID=1923877 RepID=A0ABW5RZY5_9BACL|nr:alpha/beta fold hydrolase [Sporolactobacillus shoreicorticis]MCO7127021.1 alpha/beta fold hydrolase [Sporolactobacillus shoreicorticis]